MIDAEILQIKSPQSHDYRIIVVAEETLEGRPISEIKVLQADNESYEIQGIYKIEKKDETFPDELMLLAIGQQISKDTIFRIYKKSNKLYFFICRKM